jgi:uncharacterized protein
LSTTCSTEEPAILLEGPRGSGKSTLLRSIAERRGALVLDLDDSVLQLVREDVATALASPGLVAIDESHRAPEVLSYVERIVDREGGAGRFLLAGSASSFLLPPGARPRACSGGRSASIDVECGVRGPAGATGSVG